MKRSLLLCSPALGLAVLSTPVLAQTADQLDEVVVTATRIEAIVAETPGARVIDERAIQQRGAVFAADILADVPGLSVTRTGAFGGLAQVRMRGATPGKTLVLVDGVPVNDPTEPNGAFDFSGFELGDIQRIEVLSGPQSSLWGSDAIGGVIAFTTREIDGLRAGAEAGSYDTLRGRVSAGVATDQYALGAYVSRFDTDGISAADEADGNAEDDGFENTTIGVRGRYALSPAATVDGSVRWSRGDAEIDGFPAPSFDLADTFDTQQSEQWSGFGRLRLNALGLAHQFSVSGSDVERTSFSGGFGSTFSGDRQLYRWQADGARPDLNLTYAFGAEREESSGELSSGEADDLAVTSVFVTGGWDASERLNLSAALRHDDTDDFGSETTGRVSAAYRLDGGFIVSGAYGTGFKAPSISQAVCDFCYTPPVARLNPETADGGEIALGWASADGRLDGRATLHRLNVEDQISYVGGRYVNIAETRTDGVELEGRALLGGGFDLTLAYAWTDAEDRTTGLRLQRVAEHAGSATLGWSGQRLSGALTVRAEGDQEDVDNATFARATRDGFVVANLNAAYALSEQLTLTARVENLFDELYQQVLDYGEVGLSGYVGIRLRY